MTCTSADVLQCFLSDSPLVNTSTLMLKKTTREVLNASASPNEMGETAMSTLLKNTNASLVERVLGMLYRSNPSAAVIQAWLLSVCRCTLRSAFDSLSIFVLHSRKYCTYTQSIVPAILMLPTPEEPHLRHMYLSAAFNLLLAKPGVASMISLYTHLAFNFDKCVAAELLKRKYRVPLRANLFAMLKATVTAFANHEGSMEAADFLLALATTSTGQHFVTNRTIPLIIANNASLLLVATIKTNIEHNTKLCYGAGTNMLLKAAAAGGERAMEILPLHAFRTECNVVDCTFGLLLDASLQPHATDDFKNWAASLLERSDSAPFWHHLHHGCKHKHNKSHSFAVEAILHTPTMGGHPVVKVCIKLLEPTQPVNLFAVTERLVHHLANALEDRTPLAGLKVHLSQPLSQAVLVKAAQQKGANFQKLIMFAAQHETSDKWMKSFGTPTWKLVAYCFRKNRSTAYNASVWDVLAGKPCLEQRALFTSAAIAMEASPDAIAAAAPAATAAARRMFQEATMVEGNAIFYSLKSSPPLKMHFLKKLRFGFQPGVPAWLFAGSVRNRAALLIWCFKRTRAATDYPPELVHIIVGLACTLK
jgi:hypothetical protein